MHYVLEVCLISLPDPFFRVCFASHGFSKGTMQSPISLQCSAVGFNREFCFKGFSFSASPWFCNRRCKCEAILFLLPMLIRSGLLALQMTKCGFLEKLLSKTIRVRRVDRLDTFPLKTIVMVKNWKLSKWFSRCFVQLQFVASKAF